MVLNRLCDLPCNPRMMSAQTLAFVGDAVFDLIIRERLSCKNDSAVGVLNNKKVSVVCCKAQAELIDNIWDNLSDEEKVFIKEEEMRMFRKFRKMRAEPIITKPQGWKLL